MGYGEVLKLLDVQWRGNWYEVKVWNRYPELLL